MYLVNDGKSAHATLPTQQTSKLLPRVPTHAYTDCEISGRRPTRLYKEFPPIHNAGHSKNYTSADPKQFTVSKFRLKPVILISEYFCSRCGHNGRQPETMEHNGRQRETRLLQSPRRRPHQPTPTPDIKGDNQRQWETTGDKTTSEPKKPTTQTNTKATRSKVALRTPTVNCLGKKMLNWREVVPGSVSLPVVEGEANHTLPLWGAKLGQSLWK